MTEAKKETVKKRCPFMVDEIIQGDDEGIRYKNMNCDPICALYDSEFERCMVINIAKHLMTIQNLMPGGGL